MKKPTPKQKRILTLLLYVFILMLPFGVFYWQAPVIGNRTIGNDYISFSIQHQMELQYSLKHGTFPMFVPGFAGGRTATALTLGQLYHPQSHLAAKFPGYWDGNALQVNTFLRLLSLGVAHLVLFFLLIRLGMNRILGFIISFITVYNLRMLDMFRYGASLENNTGYLLLCAAMAFYFLKPTKFIGPASIIGATYLLICGGHPQMMYLGLLGAGIAAVAIPFAIPKIMSESGIARKRILKFYGVVAICFLCGLLLASAYVIPFYFDFVRDNAVRVGQDYRWSLGYGDTSGGMLNSFFSPLNSDAHGAFGSSGLLLLIPLIPFLYAWRVRVPIVITSLWTVLVVAFLCTLGMETPLHYYFWKYVPLADTFRAPGRLTMIFPFLFLLILAWMFKPGETKLRLRVPGFGRLRERYFSAFGLMAVIAIPIFLVYNWKIYQYLPKPRIFTGIKINNCPQGVVSVVFWLGFFTILLVGLYAFHMKKHPEKWRLMIGLILAVVVVTQVTLEMRWGTWITKNLDQPTLTQMDQQKKRGLRFYGSPGFGMEAPGVSARLSHTILETEPAKFYRNYKTVSPARPPVKGHKPAFLPIPPEVNRRLETENTTDMVVVETSQVRDMDRDAAAAEDTAMTLDRVALKENTFNRLKFSADVGAPGFFVLSFPFSKKWRAAVNGKIVPLFRVNGYMQGLFLEPGKYEIDFRYWSYAGLWGMAISCLTFLLLGIYFTLSVFGFKRYNKRRLILLVSSMAIPAIVFIFWHWSLLGGDNLGTVYSWNAEKFPPADNLAYGKRTEMNSMDPPNFAGPVPAYPGLGVDGKRFGQRFITHSMQKGWWQVDLGKEQAIGEIRIFDGNFLGKKHLPLKIIGSSDGKKYRILTRVTERGKEYPWRIKLEKTKVRFVKIMSPKKGSLSFCEVEIYPWEAREYVPGGDNQWLKRPGYWERYPCTVRGPGDMFFDWDGRHGELDREVWCYGGRKLGIGISGFCNDSEQRWGEFVYWDVNGERRDEPRLVLEIKEKVVVRPVFKNERLLLEAVNERSLPEVERLLAFWIPMANENYKTELSSGSRELFTRALVRAVDVGHRGIIELLIDSGADVNGADDCGVTPLMRAVDARRADIMAVLMERGARGDMVDGKGASVLVRAVNKGFVPGVRLLRQAGEQLESSFDLEADPRRFVQVFMDGRLRRPGDVVYYVWNRYAGSLEGISPRLLVISKRGMFERQVLREDGGGVVEVSCVAPGKQGRSWYNLGFEINRNGFNIAMPGGKYIYLIVRAAVTPGLLEHKDNVVFVSDLKGRWGGEKAVFVSKKWRTYVVAKKVRPDSKRLLLGIRFSPQWKKDALKISDIRVIFTKQPL